MIDVDDVPPMLKAGYSDEDVEFALSLALNAVESYCERSFTEIEDDVVTISPRTNKSAQLPNPPVTAVSLVEGWMPRNGLMVWTPITNYAFTEDGLIYGTAGLPGVAWDGLPTWPVLPGSLRVTYDHGYADLPNAVTTAVIKAAGEFLANPERLLRYNVDDVQRQWSTEVAANFIDGNLLSAYRLVSVP